MALRLDSLKLARRLALGFCALLALVICIATVGVRALTHAQADSARTNAAMRQAADADRWRGMTQLNISRTLALAKSGNAAALKTWSGPLMKETSAEISVVQKGLEAGAASPEAKAAFADIAAKRKHYIDTRDQVFKLLDASDASANDLVESRLLPQAGEYMAAVTAFGKQQRDISEAVVADSVTQADYARATVIALAGVSMLLGALCAWFITRSVTAPLKQAVTAVEAVAAGDLSRAIEVEGRDEVATLASSFNQAAERIEALVRSNKSLLANASHELRSPLARLKMATSLMGDPSVSEREREHLRSEINTDNAELDGLVDEVLLASRLEAAPEPTNLESVDLLALAVEEGARVDAEVEGAPASVRGEERLLRRALRNLLENARRYGGGEIRVDLEDNAAAGIEIRVSDNGPGVPDAFRERIFEPFFRLPGHAERAGGVGLGLALVRQIVERHHGRIRCVRALDGGGCFVINLPASITS